MEIGTIIKLKPKYMDKGDENYNFVVVEDMGERVKIEISNFKGSIKPTQIIQKSWILEA